MKEAGLFLMLAAVLGVGFERIVSILSFRRALKGALGLIRYLKHSIADHAETLPALYAGFPGGVSAEFDRILRESGPGAAMKSTRLFRGEAEETMELLSDGIGSGSRETRLTMLAEAEERMALLVRKNDVAFGGDLKVTAVWTFGAVGFLLLCFI